jgi:hypothetical protein
MKRIKLIVASFAFLFSVGLTFATVAPVGAINVTTDACTANPDSAICKSTGNDIGTIINKVVNVLLYVLGIIAVIMMIIGGIRYTTSQGDAKQVADAKNTILYAVIGLVVAFSAYAVVNWVIAKLK